MPDKNLSPNQLAWKKLQHNTPAVIGLWIIALSVLIAILGYTITPDSTPDVNDQNPTVALKQPGFSIKILLVQKKREILPTNFFYKLLYGATSPVEKIPVNEISMVGDSVVFEKYGGENPTTHTLVKGKIQTLHIIDVIAATNVNKSGIEKNSDTYSYIGTDNSKHDIKISEAPTKVQAQIVKKTFWLGTDNFGRDNLSRLILGVRVSLFVGLIAVIISLTLGVFLGALAGYSGGRTDSLIMLLINTVWSIPTILLVFAIVLALGRGVGIIFLAVGLTMWVDVARLVRGQVLSLKQMSFVEAAKSMGYSTARIILRHILPNILGPVMVLAASNFATAILIESGLSLIGFGIQPPTPSWGTMLNENYGYAIGGKVFLALIPACAIVVLVLAFNLVGNGFRDALDVKIKD